MSITLGARSLARMEGVHPDLVRVFKTAAKMATKEEDFTILEGVRSKEQMWINYGKGRTVAQCAAKGVPAKYSEPSAAKVTWLNNPLMSNHRAHADGFSHAIDAAPYPIDWKDIGRFKKMVALIKRAAAAEGVAISCGADWAKADFPHVELAS
jgi:peptidoglycan L-alanyl-D-glutamate endopeptidase CwlK